MPHWTSQSRTACARLSRQRPDPCRDSSVGWTCTVTRTRTISVCARSVAPTWPSTLSDGFATLVPCELDRSSSSRRSGDSTTSESPAIGAAVVVLDAVDRLGLVRALVLDVGDAVAVVVGIGAAVVVLEAVLVLGLVRALVLRVGDAVAVVVVVGTAVVVLEAVLVLGIERALVLRVGDAVAVVVGIGAAVVVLEPVLVLGLVRALVERVRDAVAVAVAVDGRRWRRALRRVLSARHPRHAER